MTTTSMQFHIPDDITAGLMTEQYKLYGPVVRDTGGKIVKHLKPIAKEAEKLARNNRNVAIAIAASAIATSVIATVVGVAVWEFSGRKKKQVEAQLQCFDKAFRMAVVNSVSATLGQEQLEEIYVAANDFLIFSKEPEYRNVKLMLSDEYGQLLLDFTEALRKFNLQLANDTDSKVEPPELIRPLSNEATAILSAMTPQLEYAAQQWPKDAQPLPPTELPKSDDES